MKWHNFNSHTSLSTSKSFYEDQETFIKTFSGTKKCEKKEIMSLFSLIRDWDDKG